MTAPAPGGEGRLIARGYVQIDLKDETRGEMERLLRRLRAEAGKIQIPVELGNVTRLPAQLRTITEALQRTARPVVIPVEFDRHQAHRALHEVIDHLNDTPPAPVTVPVLFDGGQAGGALGEILDDVMDGDGRKFKFRHEMFDLDDLVERFRHMFEGLERRRPIILPVNADGERVREDIDDALDRLGRDGTTVVPVRVSVDDRQARQEVTEALERARREQSTTLPIQRADEPNTTALPRVDDEERGNDNARPTGPLPVQEERRDDDEDGPNVLGRFTADGQSLPPRRRTPAGTDTSAAESAANNDNANPTGGLPVADGEGAERLARAEQELADTRRRADEEQATARAAQAAAEERARDAQRDLDNIGADTRPIPRQDPDGTRPLPVFGDDRDDRGDRTSEMRRTGRNGTAALPIAPDETQTFEEVTAAIRRVQRRVGPVILPVRVSQRQIDKAQKQVDKAQRNLAAEREKLNEVNSRAAAWEQEMIRLLRQTGSSIQDQNDASRNVARTKAEAEKISRRVTAATEQEARAQRRLLDLQRSAAAQAQATPGSARDDLRRANAQARVAAAQDRVARAAERTRLAEERLNEVRNRGGAPESTRARAEKAVADAKRAQAAAAREVQRVEEAGNDRVRVAQEKLAALADRRTATSEQLARAEENVADAKRKQQAAAADVDRVEAEGVERVRAAEAKLEELRNRQGATTEQLSAAENKVTEAKRRQADAADDVRRAEEETLGRVRAAQARVDELNNREKPAAESMKVRAAEALAKAQRDQEAKVAKARRAAQTAADKVAAAEENLENVRRRGGASTGELRRAEALIEAQRQDADRRTQLARGAAERAADKVRTAEARLNDMQQRGTASTVERARAEAAVDEARRAADREYVKARVKVAESADAVRVAEARLNEVNRSGGASRAQLLAAEQQLNEARRAQVRAHEDVRRAAQAEEASMTSLGRSRDRALGGRSYLPFGADLVQNTGPEMERVRDELFRLQQAARIRPQYEARAVIDEMGRYRLRYFRVSRDSGTFIGEVMSQHMMKRLATMIKHPGLFGPLLTGIVAGIGGLSLAAVPALFGAIALQVQKNTAPVRQAFAQLNADINRGLMVDSAPLADSFVKATTIIGNGFEELRPQMRAVFGEMPPLIERGAQGVVKFAKNVMPSLVRAVEVAGPVVDGLMDGFEELGVGAGRFFTNVIRAAPEAGQSLRTIGVIGSDLLSMIGSIVAAVTKMFGGQLFNEAEAVFDALDRVISGFATGALPMLGVGLEMASGMLAGVLNMLAPFSSGIGSWVGTVLGATVAIRGFSAAMGVLAAGMAILKFTPAISALNRLSQQVGHAGAGFGTFITRMSGSAAAGERVSRATSLVQTGIRGVANALPVAGIAVVGAVVAWDMLTTSASEASSAMQEGGEAAKQAYATLKSYEILGPALQASFGALGGAAGGIFSSMTTDAAEYRASLDDVGKATFDVTAAQVELDSARASGNPERIAAATEALASKNRDLARAKKEAANEAHLQAQAERDVTAAMQEQTEWMLGQMNANLGYRNAVDGVRDSEVAAATALRESGAASQAYSDAVRDLEGSMLRQVDAARKLAEETYAALPDAERQAAVTKQTHLEMAQLGTTVAGPAKDAFINLARSMNDTELMMYNATVSATGLRTELVDLGGGRQVRVVVETDKAQLDTLLDDFKTMPADGLLIPLTVSTVEGQAILDQFRAGVNASGLSFIVDANPVPAYEALAAISDAAAKGRATVNLNGNDVPVMDALESVLAQISTSTPILDMNGNPVPVLDALQMVIAAANGQLLELQMSANPMQVQDTLNQLMTQVNSTSGNVTIGADSMPAGDALQSVLNAIANGAETVTINGNEVPATEALQVLLNQVNNANGTVTVNGQTMPAGDALSAFITAVNQANGTSTILANPQPGNATLQALVDAYNRARGTSTIDAQAGPGYGQLKSFADAVSGTKRSTTLDANNGPAFSSLNSFLNSIPSVITTVIRTVTGNATGAFYKPMADGGVLLPMADGGVLDQASKAFGRNLRPMSGKRAEKVPPGTFRVIGDNMTVPEIFAPLDGSQRSLNFLKMGADAFGHVMVPKDEVQGYASGGARGLSGSMADLDAWREKFLADAMRQAVELATSLRAPEPAMAGVGGGGGEPTVVIQGGVTVKLEGTWDMSNPNLPRQLVVRLEEALRDLGRSRQ